MKQIIIICIVFIAQGLVALEVPPLRGRINDNAGFLSSQQKAQLESDLRQLEERTSAQLVLLTIPSLQGEALEDYSMRVAESWGLGQQDLDNGILLLIAQREKKLRIEVGYGLEHIITDLKAGYIIRNVITPHFSRGNYSGGIRDGMSALSGLIDDQFVISDEELARYRQEHGSQTAQLPLGLILFIFIFAMSIFGRKNRSGGSLLPWLLLGSMGSRGGGSRGGFGGFGGFGGGGGGFGGGGASGGW
jgi:uncharacterized protein